MKKFQKWISKFVLNLSLILCWLGIFIAFFEIVIHKQVAIGFQFNILAIVFYLVAILSDSIHQKILLKELEEDEN